MKEHLLRYAVPVAPCYILILITLMIWPGASILTVLTAYTVIGLICAAAWRACAWRTRAGALLLMCALTLLTCGVVINVNYYTICSGGSLTHPVLLNADAYRAWWAGVALINEDLTPNYYTCYPTFAVITLFKRDIFLAIMPDVLCGLLTLIGVGELTWRLTGRRTTAFAAMIAMSLMCYFMVQATLLIKDVPLTLAMCLMALGFVRLAQHTPRRAATWGIIVAGIAITTTYRPNMLFFYVIGAIVFAVSKRPDWRLGVVALLAVGAWLWVTSIVTTNPHPTEMAAGSPKLDFVQMKTMAWDKVTGNYSTFPVWKKLCILPASVVLQFLIPFPWNFARDMVFGPTVAVAHFGYTWYLAGGLFLYWIVALRRKSPQLMVRLAVWGVILYVATAYSYSGRISRYCLPDLPLIMPAVAYTAVTAGKRPSLWRWLAVFAALMATALTICHKLHTDPL